MRLGELIDWLEKQKPTCRVPDGFGEPHTDRGSYADLAFSPVKNTTYGEMLAHARSADGRTFGGWKGGDFKMHSYSKCLIGGFGCCGEEITSAQLKLWELTCSGWKGKGSRAKRKVPCKK